MLPSLISRATIFLHPAYIAAVMHAGIFKKRVSHKTVIAVEPVDGVTEYTGVIDALKKLLNKPEWKNCSANIILAGNFTQFRVVVWNDNLTQLEQKIRVLDQIEDLYGVDGKTFHVFMLGSGYRKNSLAFALDESFYQELQGLEKMHLIRLNSMFPYFVLITNYWRQSIMASAWIIVKENASIYCAKIIDNSWLLIKVIAEKNGWEQEVTRMLHRDKVQSGEDANASQVYFYDEGCSNANTEAVKSIHKNVVILDRHFKKDGHQQLSFLSYLP